MKSVKLVAQARTEAGKGNAARLRRAGQIPAVVYGVGKANQNIQLDEHAFGLSLRGHAGEHLLLDLEVGGEPARKVLLQEVQHHPVSGRPIHVDLHEISMTEKLRLEVPLRLVGEPTGVSQQGGILEHILRAVEVECLPMDIPEHVDVDVSAMSVGQRLAVGDIKLEGAKFAIVSSADLTIASVMMPRAEEEVKPEAAAAAGEPEVITAKKEEGEEAAGAEGEKKEGGKKPEAKKPEAKASEAKDAGKKKEGK